MVPCISDQEREEQPVPAPRRRVVREIRQPGNDPTVGLRLHVIVPENVREALKEAGLGVVDEINRVVDALWIKFTTAPSPAPTATHALEVTRFRRLTEAEPEVLTRPERMFVILNEAHERVTDLIEDPAVASELVTKITLRLAEGVCLAQRVVRQDWGITEEEKEEL